MKESICCDQPMLWKAQYSKINCTQYQYFKTFTWHNKNDNMKAIRYFKFTYTIIIVVLKSPYSICFEKKNKKY